MILRIGGCVHLNTFTRAGTAKTIFRDTPRTRRSKYSKSALCYYRRRGRLRRDSGLGSGFQGTVTLQSQQAAAVTNWRLEFDYAANITSIWDAKIVSHTGSHYVVTGSGWNNTLAAGGSVAFGFVAAPASGQSGPGTAVPVQYVLNGVSLDGTPTPPTPAPLPTLSILDASVAEGNTGSTNRHVYRAAFQNLDHADRRFVCHGQRYGGSPEVTLWLPTEN